MVTISNSTVRQNIWETIYDDLSNELSDKTVTASFIDTFKNGKFKDQIVIYPITINEEQLVLNRSLKNQPIIIRIDIFSKKNKDIDLISDRIHSFFDSNETSYEDSHGLYDMATFDTSVDTIFIGDQKVHIKTITINFTRLKS